MNVKKLRYFQQTFAAHQYVAGNQQQSILKFFAHKVCPLNLSIQCIPTAFTVDMCKIMSQLV